MTQSYGGNAPAIGSVHIAPPCADASVILSTLAAPGAWWCSGVPGNSYPRAGIPASVIITSRNPTPHLFRLHHHHAPLLLPVPTITWSPACPHSSTSGSDDTAEQIAVLKTNANTSGTTKTKQVNHSCAALHQRGHHPLDPTVQQIGSWKYTFQTAGHSTKSKLLAQHPSPKCTPDLWPPVSSYNNSDLLIPVLLVLILHRLRPQLRAPHECADSLCIRIPCHVTSHLDRTLSRSLWQASRPSTGYLRRTFLGHEPQLLAGLEAKHLHLPVAL